MDLLTEILCPARPTAIVDVGANPIDGEPPYKAMLAALGDGTPRTLHVCDLEGMTSLPVPDPAHLALFNFFPIWGKVKNQIPVSTRKPDDIAQITQLDFLKMDVQGVEREVLAHGSAKLAETVAIRTEVSFVPLYEGQPCFGEMDLALRELEFLPHCVTGTKIWPIAPMVVGDAPNRGIRQLLETDMVYVKDFSRPENMSAEQWNGSYGLALKAILTLIGMGAPPADANRRYLASLPSRKAN
jgi:FkbM family methyltransferase